MKQIVVRLFLVEIWIEFFSRNISRNNETLSKITAWKDKNTFLFAVGKMRRERSCDASILLVSSPVSRQRNKYSVYSITPESTSVYSPTAIPGAFVQWKPACCTLTQICKSEFPAKDSHSMRAVFYPAGSIFLFR